jgi:DNA-binding NarL/FixJ family response regulator
MEGRVQVESLDAVPLQADGSAEAAGWWDHSDKLVDKRTEQRPFERCRVKHDYGLFLCFPEVSTQERDVFERLAEGYKTWEIASELDLSAPRISQVKHAISLKLAAFFGPDIRPGWPDPRRWRYRPPEAG